MGDRLLLNLEAHFDFQGGVEDVEEESRKSGRGWQWQDVGADKEPVVSGREEIVRF